MRCKMLGARDECGWVVKSGRRLDARGVGLDRAIPNGFQDPVRDPPMRSVGLDVVKAGKNKAEPSDKHQRKHRA